MKERVNVRTETVERYDTVVHCDRCGVKVRGRKMGEFTDATISIAVGSSYPEGGSYTLTKVDCCDGCWDEVRAAIEAIGFTFWDEEVDW